MIDGVLGRKLGMVQVFDPEGRMRGATVIEAGPCLITQIKTNDRDGYDAVQLGFGSAKRRNKPMRGHLKQQGDLRYLREFKVDNPSEHAVGERIGVEIFEPGDRVNITGTSKGKGFAGVVKRYHFAGGPKTHGQSDRHRARGSIGAGNTPGRVFKGKKMAIPTVDRFIDQGVDFDGVEKMWRSYGSVYTIDLDDNPDLKVIRIFRELNIPHNASEILALAPVNVTDFETSVE